ncbi:MAG: IgA Peptidase M64 [Bacteroidales bacterium]|nr:IgA Peptidase M64 [Bacteroidales bacterium]
MKSLSVFAAFFLMTLCAEAQVFDRYFTDRTLRLDYQLCGDAKEQHIYLSAVSELPLWAGRRCNLSQMPYEADGRIRVYDSESHELIYANAFSSLFSEWLSTPEASSISRAFENTQLIPMPQKTVDIEVAFYDSHHRQSALLKHRVDPDDILIRQRGKHPQPITYVTYNGGSYDECIDIAILSEGYANEHVGKFIADAQKATAALFSHEPFATYKDRFNVTAVFSQSVDGSVSVPREKKWCETAFSSNYSTFYSDRYLTTLNVCDIHDALCALPYEHIVILANESEYGGGGIFNSYTLTTASHDLFEPVVVHEIGHSFGGLADEYCYENETDTLTYPLDVEPWEPNVTTKVDFGSKWQNEMGKNGVSLIEGAAYNAKGLYRSSKDCRMRSNDAEGFCSVCQKALVALIKFYTEEK